MAALNSLKTCYKRISSILSDKVEPFSAVELVERYRRYWKPDDVKVVLLAESHVFTSDSDLSFQLKPIQVLTDYPRSYAKFVYCVAYGEESLTEGDRHPGRDGTPQFWKIFFSCINNVESNASFSSVMKSETTDAQRIQNKVNLLKELKHRGVWLVDASVMALYNNGKKPPFNVMLEAVRTSWASYTQTS